jgi:hypothetical protein
MLEFYKELRTRALQLRSLSRNPELGGERVYYYGKARSMIEACGRLRKHMVKE